MTSEKQTLKFHTGDASDLGSVSEWMKQIFNQSEALARYEVTTRHQYGISALVRQTSYCRDFVSNNSTSVLVFFMLLSVGLYVFGSSLHNDEA